MAPAISERFSQVLPRSAEAWTRVTALTPSLNFGPKKSCDATYSPFGSTAMLGEPMYRPDDAGLCAITTPGIAGATCSALWSMAGVPAST